MRILTIVDSHKYARANCYIHQLLTTLERFADTTIIDKSEILLRSPRAMVKFSDFDRVLVCLKLRTLARSCAANNEFGHYLSGTPVFIYEQDPWESISDQGSYRGAYEIIASKLNVRSFLNTSKWWSDCINSRGLPSRFVNMWMLPEYCSSDPLWSERKIDVGFCGQLHPHRKELFERLRSVGIEVHHFPSGDYGHYLKCLSQTKIFVHSEQTGWSIDGKKLDGPNALWIKDVEAAARGCFTMRERDIEAISYHSWNIPTIRPFSSFEQLVENIRRTLADWSQSPVTQNDETVRAVNYIRSARGWQTVIDAMQEDK